MRELRLLVGVSFRQMLHTFATGQGKKKNATAAGAVGLMAFLALYISGLYSWLMGELLEEAGVLEFLLPVMTLLAVAVSLVFTFFAASGIIFSGKDTDLILSMPVSAFSVMLSRMSALYLENLLFVGLWMIPSGAAGYIFGERTDPLYFLRLALSILFVPFLPSLLASLGAYVVAWAGARMKHRALLSNLISIVLFLALMLGCMQINQIGTLLLNHREEAHRPVGQRNGGKPGGAAGQLDPLRPAFFWRNLAVFHPVSGDPFQPSVPTDPQRLSVDEGEGRRAFWSHAQKGNRPPLFHSQLFVQRGSRRRPFTGSRRLDDGDEGSDGSVDGGRRT